MDVKLIFKYYWPHIKKYKKFILTVFLLYGLGVVATNMLSPLLYKKIIDLISSGQNPLEISDSILTTVLLLGVLIFAYNVLFRIADYLITFSQSKITKELSDDAFVRIERHSYGFFSGSFTGSLVAKIRRYISSFEEITDQIVFTAWFNGLALISSIGVLTYFSRVLGLILLVWFLLYIGMTALFVKKKIEKDILTAEANSKVTGRLSDVITNILNVKMFASNQKEYLDFAKVTDWEEKKRRDAWYFQNLQFAFQGFFIGIFEFVGMYTAVYLWLNGYISAGTIILMQIYVFTAFNITWNLGRNFTRTIRAFAEAKEMVDVFEQPIEVKDLAEPEKCLIREGKIDLKDIHFSYENKKKLGKEIFQGLSLTITPGEKVGLVGPSGAGKTTITKLILRFADLEKGEILIDGQNIKNISQDDLRSKIVYVPQDPVLFHRTIKENISYSRPGASEEEIVEAAKKSHSHEFISQLPNGYDTYVGERGVKLSGGERQRVAIARAMLKNVPILVLDEATSSLDSISENYIQEAFDELMKGRTTIVIAHRLSTIQKMDRILVLEEGKIIEQGTHKRLLAKKGLYYRLWKQQSHGFVGE